MEAFTEAVDILPTVLDLAGSDIPAHLDGHSLAPFLDGATPAGWRDAAHWEFDFRSISKRKAEKHFGIEPAHCNLAVVRTEKFKYVHFGGGLPPVLFDLVRRSGRDAERGGRPGLSRRPAIDMAERLLAWRAEHLDQSLALSELTDDGIAGAFPFVALKQAKARAEIGAGLCG